MSKACEMRELPLGKLQPAYVEFTDTRGVLRCLRPEDPRRRAQGLAFLCPRCRGNKNKAHFITLLFSNATPGARPLGRFEVTRRWIEDAAHEEGGYTLPDDLNTVTVHTAGDPPGLELRPHDVPCAWRGYVQDGKVSWRPSWAERHFSKCK